MGARPYQPALGRFLTVDPVPGGCANDYTYVHGDPIARSDLSGTNALCTAVSVLAYASVIQSVVNAGVKSAVAQQTVSSGLQSAVKNALSEAAKGLPRTSVARASLLQGAALIAEVNSLPYQGLLTILQAGCEANLDYQASERWKAGQTADVPQPATFDGAGIPYCNGGRCFA
jgi:hypothetical protein